jgi:hypothetical protein
MKNKALGSSVVNKIHGIILLILLFFSIQLYILIYSHRTKPDAIAHRHQKQLQQQRHILLPPNKSNVSLNPRNRNFINIIDLPKKEKSIQFKNNGHDISFAELEEPLFVLFGNAAYKSMLMNYVCNTLLFPGMHERTVIIVTDHETMISIEALNTKVNVWLIEDTKQEAYDYDTPMYLQLMLLRGQHLLQLLGKKTIVWLEADATYYQNLLEQPEILYSKSDITLFLDWQSFGGGFIRFAATNTSKQFYSDIIAKMQSSSHPNNGIPNINDQSLLNQQITDSKFTNYSVFDDCKYRSGMYFKNADYRLKCSTVKPIVQQHNWIIGVQEKIRLAKEKKSWFMTDDDQQCKTRDMRIVIMTKDRSWSLERLLNSIKNAKYKDDIWAIDLYIHIDRDSEGHVDKKTLEVADSFQWEYGFFSTKVWESQVGLLGQWIHAWPCELFPPSLYKAVVLLEDDLEVSPYFSQWFLGAHNKYKSESIGAVTGMRPQLVAKSGVETSIHELIPKGVMAFAYKLMATWSLSPTYENWKKFREWYFHKQGLEHKYDIIVDGIKPSEWYSNFVSTGTTSRMWEMWYIKFTEEFDYYTIYPWVDGEGSMTIVCNWKERGLNYDGEANFRDFPLVQDQDKVDALLLQDSLPKVEWGVSFYICLVGDLYGQFGNQLLTISWAQKKAKNSGKFLRITSMKSPNKSRLFLKENWNNIFDQNAFPNILIDEADDEKCHARFTFEDMYFEQLKSKHEEIIIPVPKLQVQEDALNAWQRLPKPIVSVHGRSFENTCNNIQENICPNYNFSGVVENMCNYSSYRLRKLFGVEPEIPMVLFSDKQNEVLDSSFELISQELFPVQLWMQVISDTHIGNPMSTLDYIIYKWKKQKGLDSKMLPESCYGV